MSKTICIFLIATLCLSNVLAFSTGSSFRAPTPSFRPPAVHHTPAPIHHTPAPIHRPAPPVHHTPAPIHRPTPPVHHTPTPPVHHTPTPIHRPTPPVHHTPTPPVHHNPTPIHHTPTPPVHHNPTPIHHTPTPAVHHTPTPPVHHTPTPPVHHTPTPTTPKPNPQPASSGSYPHYSQGDARWKTQSLGHGSATIGAKGCLMSSVASMVAGKGGHIDGAAPNPATMNKWLQGHGGFSGNNFVWDSLKPLGFNFEGKVSDKGHITNALNSGKNVLLNVNGGHHYVLATGVDSTGYTVMDPGYPRTHYNFGEVVQAGVYHK